MRGRTARIPERTVSRARQGDEAALRELVEAAYPTIRRWALVRMGDWADADDLTQDVLVTMIRKLHTFQGDAPFESWLYALTRNAALDRYRRTARTRRFEDDPRPSAKRPCPPPPTRPARRRAPSCAAPFSRCSGGSPSASARSSTSSSCRG